MSCQQRSNLVGATAAVRTGLSEISSKAGNLIGEATALRGEAGNLAGAVTARAGQLGRSGVKMVAAASDQVSEQVARRAAPVSNKMLQKVDRPAVAVARALPYVAAGLSLVRFKGYLVGGPGRGPVAAVAVTPRSVPEMLRHRQALQRVQQGLTVAGLAGAVTASVVADVSKGSEQERTLQLKSGQRVVAEVGFQPAPKLTGLLNRLDLVGSHRLGQNVTASDGEVVKVGLAVWHRGTSVIRTSGGERTLTHLRSLSLPAQHYYFDRKLTENEVAGLVTSREQAHRLPGYVGEIHRLESLTPAWSATKQALITNRLYYPPQPADWRLKEDEA